MQQTFTHVPSGPASTDDISIQLYSQHKLNQDIKASLASHLTSKLPKASGNRVLIIGGRIGVTTELLIPFSQKIDVVTQKQYIEIQEVLFKKRQNINYTFYLQGYVGEQNVMPKSDNTDCQVNFIEISKFHDSIKNQNKYNVIILQNMIVHPQINILNELMRLDHEVLITMIVPGKIVHEGLFELLSGIQQNILHIFYDQQVHDRLQYMRYLTGRRKQVNFWEIFIWRKKNLADVDTSDLKPIADVLKQEVQKNKIGDKKGKANGQNVYETQQLINQYMQFHYGTAQYFTVKNFPLHCTQKIIQCAKQNNVKGRALDLGCAVGRSTFQLAKYFNEVIGIDYSQAFVDAAQKMFQNQTYTQFKNKVKFQQGDACKLNKDLGKFNVIFGGNLLDRLYDPSAFLTHITQFMQKKSLLILTSPYTWLQSWTNVDKWIGGQVIDGKQIRTYDKLKQILNSLGLKQVKQAQDIHFVIKQNHWVYQYTAAQATYWIKQ